MNKWTFWHFQGCSIHPSENYIWPKFFYCLLQFELGQKIQLKVAASTIRTVEKKGGLDDFLVSTPNSKLPEKAKKLKKTILSQTN